MKRARPVLIVCFSFVTVWICECSRSNNLLFGRVQAEVGTHTVVVTDCYRTSVPAPHQMEAGATGQPSFRFTPCRDADVLINGDQLIVNGQSYGRLDTHDGVLVDHGVVSITRSATRASN